MSTHTLFAKRLKALLSFSLAIILITSNFILVLPKVLAANIGTSALVNTFVATGQTIKAASNSTAVLGLNLANGTARTLTAAQVTVAGPTGFDPSVELAALGTATSSGVSLWVDGVVAGEDGSFSPNSNGDSNVALTSAPTYSAATRLSAFTPTSTANYTINGSSNTASPALALGSVVFTQSGTAAGSWGMVTTALSASALSVNGSAVANGAYRISKIAGAANHTANVTTGAAGANAWTVNSGGFTPALAVGDIVLFQTGTDAAVWGVVTNGTNTNQNTFAINGANLSAATAYQITRVSDYSPATSVVDGSVAGKLTGGLNFAVGDLVIGTTGSGYAWGVVTTAENVSAGGTISALRINGASATSLFSTSSQVAKITASGTGLATAATPTLTAGDIAFANPVLNAAPVAGYNWHAATTGGAGAAASALRLDGASAAPFWPYTTTLTPAAAPAIPADNTTAGNVGSDFYIVVKTAAVPTNGKQFNVSIRANGDLTISDSDTVNLSGLPTNTATLTIDTTAPTLSANTTGPASGSSNVPVSTFMHLGFSEFLDQSTLNTTNITLATSTGSVPISLRPFPDGVDILVSSPPTFAAGSRFAKAPNTSFGFYFMQGTNAIQPQGSYVLPTAGDIVYFQNSTFPAEVGVITDATLTSGTFSVNNFNLFGGQSLSKFGSVATTSAVSAATAFNKGDIVVVNTTANPTAVRYGWHIVTSADTVAVNHANFRLDSASSQPTFVSGSSITALAPSATAAITATSSLASAFNFVLGDLVFAKITANADNLNSYGWHLVTAAENVSLGSLPSDLRLDGASSAPTLATSSQVSKITPAAQGAATDTSTSFSFGDMLFANTTANAAANGAYNFHLVSSGNGGSGGVASTNLRLDNAASSLAVSTAYTITASVGIKDQAGNALASPQTITFTTGGTSGTNTTPPFVQSTLPQSGNQSFSPNAPIKITFSVGMATSGSGSATSSSNIGLFTDNFGVPGTQISASLAYDSSTNTVTLTPAATLTASTNYIVRVAQTTTSSTSAPLMNEFKAFFKTASGSDSAAPTVLGVFPANGATTTRSSVVNVGFSEDMDGSTINTTTITLATTAASAAVAGTVSYSPSSRSASFAPSVQLAASTNYFLTVTTGVKDLAANALAANYTSTFNSDNTTDSTLPMVSFGNADNFGVAVTFSEPVKSGGGPSAADNVGNYTLESPVGSSISLAGKTVVYDGGTKTARITGLALQNGNTFKITVSNLVQDLASNSMDTTQTPARNTAFGTVQNSSTTGGQLGPGSGPAPNAGMQGMNPTRVSPKSKAAGVTSDYHVEFLASTSIPLGGQIVLTFPSGFVVTNAAAAGSTASFCNSDLNGMASGAVTIDSIANDNAAGTITITTAGAASGANAFMCLDFTTIVNSTIPSTAGYTVDIKTKDTAGNNRAVLETKTSSSFFLGQAGSRTLTVNVFNDNGAGGGTAGNNLKDGSEAGVASVTVFLYSPAVGGQEATTNGSGVASFTSLADDDYMIGLKPSSLSGTSFSFNSAPQNITIAANLTKNFGITAAPYTISGTIYGPAATLLDIFASSNNGFVKVSTTTNSTSVAYNSVTYGGSITYSLPVQATTTYNIGVGPAIPENFLTPGAPPPPPPTFTFMPPPNQTISTTSSNVSNLNFALTTAGNTITGTVVDSSGNGVSNAGVFCRPAQSSTSGSSGGFGTGAQTNTSGAFTVNVTPGVYLCGVFKPGMPNVPDKQITVPTSGSNTPATLGFLLDASTSLTITGTVKDDGGNAVSYAGVGGRRVNSTSDTTPVGGDSSNFVGGPADSNGAYTLYVTAGTWVLEAFAPGFGRLGTKTVTVTTSSLSGQDFSAETLSLGTITGSSTKASIAQQGVMVRAEGSSGANMAISDSTGSYSLKVPAGSYTVYCYFPGVGESTPLTSVAVTANSTTAGQDCTVAAPITITVNLTDGTNPLTNAFVDVRDSNGRGNGTNSSSASSTNATLAVYTISVPPGTYTVRVGHPSYGPVGTTASVNSTRSITYTASAGQMYAVSGTVSAGGSGVNSAWVSIIGTPTGQSNVINIGGQTNSSGVFSINAPAGSYVIRADKPGYKSPAAAALTVSAATSAGTITLTAASRTITGTVSLSGSGVSGAFVDANDGSGGYAVAQTNSSGAYSLAVDTGTWTIRARSMGYEGGPIGVTVGGADVAGQNITLGAISGFTIRPEKQENVTPTSGGLFTNSDIHANFKMNIPANALGTSSNAGTVKTQINTAVPNPSTGTVLSKNAITISAVDSSGQPIKNLNDNVTIVVPYTESDIPSGGSESNLILGVWNESTLSYDTLSTTVDSTANTLTAVVSHFSDFAPLLSSTSNNYSAPAAAAAASNSYGGGGVSSPYGGSGGASPSPSPSPASAPANLAAAPAVPPAPAPVIYSRALKLGQKGNDVVSLQTFLEQNGFLKIPKGVKKGLFGAATKAALMKYQKKVGLKQTGLLDEATKQKVAAGETAAFVPPPAAPKPAAAAKAKTLSVGSRGQEVVQLQNILESEGLLVMPKGVKKGLFGAVTKKALLKYQKNMGLKQTGKLDAATRAQLNLGN